MKKTIFAVVMLAGVAMAGPASAQTSCATSTNCSVNANATVTVPTLFSLEISSGLTAGAVALTAPTAASLGSYVANTGPTFTVKANKAWQLSIASAASAFTYSGTESGVKSAADLTWSTTADGTFAGVGTTAASVTTGSRSNTGSATVYFRTNYAADYSDASNRPGSYSLGLVFTIAAQ